MLFWVFFWKYRSNLVKHAYFGEAMRHFSKWLSDTSVLTVSLYFTAIMITVLFLRQGWLQKQSCKFWHSAFRWCLTCCVWLFCCVIYIYYGTRLFGWFILKMQLTPRKHTNLGAFLVCWNVFIYFWHTPVSTSITGPNSCDVVIICITDVGGIWSTSHFSLVSNVFCGAVRPITNHL